MDILPPFLKTFHHPVSLRVIRGALWDILNKSTCIYELSCEFKLVIQNTGILPRIRDSSFHRSHVLRNTDLMLSPKTNTNAAV